MTDYGHDLSFGIFVTPQADAGRRVTARVFLNERGARRL